MAGSGGLASGARRSEELFNFLLLSLMAILPSIGVVARLVSWGGIRGSADYIQHLVLWVALAGGALASRDGKHLSLTLGVEKASGALKAAAGGLASFLTTLVATMLTLASLSFVLLGFEPGARVGVLPIWLATLALPLGFALMTGRAATGASGRTAKIAAVVGILAGLFVGAEPLDGILTSPFVAVPAGSTIAGLSSGLSDAAAMVMGVGYIPLAAALVVGVLVGAPVFVLLGGLAIAFFLHAGGALEVIPNQAYTMLSGPIIAAVPLFTLAGFIISESKAGERLVRLFRALFGWLPGGLAIVSVLICAFLTTFTGASGVTILAVGGLLMYVLTAGSYSQRFSTGLLTASGSIGLLFPPSLPVILYGVMAQVSIRQMFVGGILPGAFMVVTLAVMGALAATRQKIPREPFAPREALAGLLPALGEVLLPFLILLLFLGGVMTLVETAAFSVLYALVLEVGIHRDIKVQDLPTVFLKSALVMGGVLVILSAANGLSYYIVDAEIPTQLTSWLASRVSSPLVFLLLLNVALLIVGCFLDIFSAITVVVPLIVPIAAAYHVNPVHLGIIFLANLELGYLTPPVGMNLFLASYRFGEPLAKIYRYVVPFLAVELAAVLVITYWPWLTTALLPLAGN